MSTLKQFNHFLHKHDAYLAYYYNYKHYTELTTTRAMLRDHQEKGILEDDNYHISAKIDGGFYWHLASLPNGDSATFWGQLYNASLHSLT